MKRAAYTTGVIVMAVWLVALFEFHWRNPELTQMQVFKRSAEAVLAMDVWLMLVVVAAATALGWRSFRS